MASTTKLQAVLHRSSEIPLMDSKVPVDMDSIFAHLRIRMLVDRLVILVEGALVCQARLAWPSLLWAEGGMFGSGSCLSASPSCSFSSLAPLLLLACASNRYRVKGSPSIL